MRRLPTVALLVASYLAGAFPTAELVIKARGRDVHHEGSGNPGATNAYRLAGPRAAALVMAVDLGKGALATRAGAAFGTGALGPACGVAAVVGHCFPPRHPLEGGKGVATAGGMLLALDPPMAFVAATVWAVLAKATGRASVASVVVAGFLPLAAIVGDRPRAERWALAATSAVILLRHRDNIARLQAGEEGPVTGY